MTTRVPAAATGQSCAFCSSRDVAWVHPLAEERARYREYGKEHTLPSSWTLCDRCESIYVSGDDDAAVDLMRASGWSWVATEDVAECVRGPLAAFRRADLGSRPIGPEPASVAEARRLGFVPLRELTGVADELGPLWPAGARLWVDELGPAPGEDEDDPVPDRWLVRSPWPEPSVRQVLDALWRWVEQKTPPTPRSPDADHERIREFFGLGEAEVVGLADPDS